jgi:tetratricopeptide (TPR) repeat protein
LARKDAHDKGWGTNVDEHLWGELANAGISERTQAAIKAGMEIDPSQRPQTMTEFRKLLCLEKREEIVLEDESDGHENWFKLGKYILLVNEQEAIDHCEWVSNDRSEMEFCGILNTIGDKIFVNDKIFYCSAKYASNFDRGRQNKFDIHVYWRNRGSTLFALRRYDEALRDFNRALAIQENYYTRCGRGIILCNLRRYQEAILDLDPTIETIENSVIRNSPEYHYYYGCAMVAVGELRPAISSFDLALKTMIYILGTRIDSGNLEEVNHLDSTVELKKFIYYAWFFRGFAMNELGRYDEAIISYDRAVEIHPDHYQTLQKRGRVLLLHLNRSEEAIDRFTRSRTVSRS